jgi:glycosyltransferase involved in cell wall biosynthesis
LNILFLYSEPINPITGGVERITYLLANFLETKGIKVLFLGLNENTNIKDERQFFLPDKSSLNSDLNIKFFRTFLVDNSINILINKGGTNPEISKLAYLAKFENIKLISVVHNSLLGTIKNFSSAHKVKFTKMGLGWLLPLTDYNIIKYILLRLYKLKYSSHYKSLCKNSDYVILESEKFKQELIFLIENQSIENVIGISNFVVFDKIKKLEKKNEILYVGRINTSQKRVDLLLKIWSLLYLKFPDWSLKIVGGGDELESIKSLSVKYKLDNIFFYGFQDAKPFYETASIISLTSAYEGFGITLIEAMQFGVVPIAFNSYLSVTDIINDKVNGCLIEPFNIQKYADALSELMTSSDKLKFYSLASEQYVKKFDLNYIGEHWLEIIKN